MRVQDESCEVVLVIEFGVMVRGKISLESCVSGHLHLHLHLHVRQLSN